MTIFIKLLFQRIDEGKILFYKGQKMIWTKEKTEILIEMYYDKSEEEICEAIGNTWGAIQGRANKLGLQRNYCKDVVWDENKKEILRKMYWISSWEEIFESLGIFNKRKILDQANKMGLERKKNFEEWEDDFIIENYSILSTEKISKKINRPIGSIQTRASQLGVNKQNVWKRFSDEEIISMLKKTYSFSLLCILPSDLTEKKLYKIFLPYIK